MYYYNIKTEARLVSQITITDRSITTHAKPFIHNHLPISRLLGYETEALVLVLVLV